MSNVIRLSDYHEANLRTLATYLLSDNMKAHFSMEFYGDIQDIDRRSAIHCGSVGCAIGHAPVCWHQKTER